MEKMREEKEIPSETAGAESMKAANKRLWHNKQEVAPKVIIFSKGPVIKYVGLKAIICIFISHSCDKTLFSVLLINQFINA